MWKNGNWDPGVRTSNALLVKWNIGLWNNLDTEVNLQHEIFFKKQASAFKINWISNHIRC